MASWPAVYDSGRWETSGAATAASDGATVTAGALNTKGSWAELAAATALAGDLLIVQPGACSAAADYLVDIGIGAAGSEQTIVSNLLICAGKGPGAWFGCPIVLPISIPAGTRLAARAQATTASATLTLIAHALARGWLDGAPLSRVATYGAATADSGGTSIDPGGSANTKGAWTQLASATSADHRALLLALGNQANTVRTAGSWLVDIGIGAAGSEQTIVSNLFIRGDSSNDCVSTAMTLPLPIAIPAGTRLAVRAQSDITNATDRLFDAVLYGVG